jgi:3alpha(or 20beta)-hydroxysteroid dehydrogenase
VLGMHAVAPLMVRQGDGAIVNMGSVGGFLPPPTAGAYGASKAGLVAATRAAAQELGPHGVRVNAVLPGHTDTPMNRRPRDDFAGIPLGRIGRPEEIAAAAVFLASPWASYCTGTSLVVDGGWSVTPAGTGRRS